MPVSQWVMLDCSLSWHSAQHWLSNRNTQYIRNMFEDWGAISRKRCIWYGVGVNRWPIGNHPSFMLYRLARSPLTQRNWKVKDRFGLVRSANSAQAQYLLLCPALSYSALSREAPRKVGRWCTVKYFPALGDGICAPPLLKCFRRHWSEGL